MCMVKTIAEGSDVILFKPLVSFLSFFFFFFLFNGHPSIHLCVKLDILYSVLSFPLLYLSYLYIHDCLGSAPRGPPKISDCLILDMHSLKLPNT